MTGPEDQRSEKAARRATLADVAARVGTSTITVSRALRQPDMVSQALRARIELAVEELAYVPNPAARALASQRSSVIGVLIPSVTNNVFVEVLSGIYDGVADSALDIQLANTRYDPRHEEKLVRVFLGQRPSGMIISGIDQAPTTRAILASAQLPIVQIMEMAPDPLDMIVGFSHRDAAASGARHLIDQGYRRPAFLAARMDPRTHRRLAGFLDVTKAAGLFDAARVVAVETPSSVALGRLLLGRLLEQAPDVDAILCNNDDLALGVQFEALARGIDIPRRLGLCGFNDLEVMAAAHPAITSVQTHRYEMGRRAVTMIRDRLAGRPIEAPSVDLGHRLICRASTART